MLMGLIIYKHDMLSIKDEELLAAKGISKQQVEEQLACFAKGFPYLDIVASASVEKGIKVVPKEEQSVYMDVWEEYLDANHKILKFVPASGAASRMFKDLFAFLAADYSVPTTAFEKHFFENIKDFAFYKALDKVCLDNDGSDIEALMENKEYKTIVRYLLEPEGLNYGKLPKGMLLFHSYPEGPRTALEEHLAEGAMYARNSSGEVNIHFTVSPEHLPLFKQLLEDKMSYFEEKFSVKYDVSFSLQKPSTDTIAATPDNEPFRDSEGNLFFRPGGHGIF